MKQPQNLTYKTPFTQLLTLSLIHHNCWTLVHAHVSITKHTSQVLGQLFVICTGVQVSHEALVQPLSKFGHMNHLRNVVATLLSCSKREWEFKPLMQLSFIFSHLFCFIRIKNALLGEQLAKWYRAWNDNPSTLRVWIRTQQSEKKTKQKDSRDARES